jgi:uncharacterized protein YbjT (DUF2867 family)
MHGLHIVDDIIALAEWRKRRILSCVERENAMTFAIAGVSGHTGKIVADALLARGKQVRVIVREAEKGATFARRGAEVAVADLGDSAALSAALRGAQGAYLLIPPNPAAPRFREYQDRVSRALAEAAQVSGVAHVVLLSSLGAQHAAGTGPIAGLHYTEQLLGQLKDTATSSLRAGYFYENLAGTLGAVKEAGVLPSFFPADYAFPMASTGDIGRLAAELLLEQPARSQVIELGTNHSHAEIARVLGELLHKRVSVQEAPLSAVAPTFASFGFSQDLAAQYAEMVGALRAGLATFEGKHRHVASGEPLDHVFKALLGL